MHMTQTISSFHDLPISNDHKFSFPASLHMPQGRKLKTCFYLDMPPLGKNLKLVPPKATFQTCYFSDKNVWYMACSIELLLKKYCKTCHNSENLKKCFYLDMLPFRQNLKLVPSFRHVTSQTCHLSDKICKISATSQTSHLSDTFFWEIACLRGEP